MSLPRRAVTTATLLAALASLALAPLPRAAAEPTPAASPTTAGSTPAVVVEPVPDVPADARRRATLTAQASAEAATVAGVPALHSLAGASRTVFLDLDGHTLSGHRWSGLADPYVARPWSVDADPALSTVEAARIREVWAMVAEDFAPFGVDVTTEDPGAAALERSSSADQTYGMRVVLSDTDTWQVVCSNTRCGGIAYVDVFDEVGGSTYQPAWVFPQNFADDAKAMGDAISHEVGHTLGLSHDGNASQAYHGGQGAWQPIMGLSGARPLSQWSNGDYTGASNREDDVALIARGGAPLLVDDVGDSPATAAAGLPAGPRTIGTRTDTDWFRLSGCVGDVAVTASPAAVSPDLDVDLRLYDGAGALLAADDPAVTSVSRSVASGLGASAVARGTAGDVLVRVDGVGWGSPLATGYSDYGSLGRYTLALTGSCTGAVGTPPPSTPTTPTTPPVVAAAPGAVGSFDLTNDGGRALLAWTPPADDGGSPVTGYRVRLGSLDEVYGASVGRLAVTGLTGVVTATVSAVSAAGEGAPTTRTLDLGAPPSPAAPATPAVRLRATVAPSLAGPAAVGRRVTARPGTWTRPATLTYRWRLGTRVLGRAASYRPTAKVLGKRLTVTVTATAAGQPPVVVVLRTAKVRR